MGKAPSQARIQLQVLQGLFSLFSSRCFGQPLLVDEGLGQLIHDPMHGIQVLGPVLKEHGQSGPAKYVILGLRQPHQLRLFEPDAALHPGILRQKAHQSLAQGGLARAGFPHQGGDPARNQLQADRVQGQKLVFFGAVEHAQFLNGTVHKASFNRGSKTCSRLTARKVMLMMSRLRQRMGGRSQLHQISR